MPQGEGAPDRAADRDDIDDVADDVGHVSHLQREPGADEHGHRE